MKKMALLSLLALLPLCVQAMETGTTLPVFFRFIAPANLALHNQITVVQVEDGATLAQAVALFKARRNIPPATPLNVVFGAQSMGQHMWDNMNIISHKGNIIIDQMGSAEIISISNPINIGFPRN